MTASYKTCKKCGVRYSTLTRHKCFKPEEQDGRPKWDEAPPGDDEPGDSGNGKGETEQDGEGQGEGQDQPEGEGEAKQEGEGEGEGQGEGGEMPPPEPTAMEMVTLLRFAALTAKEAVSFVKVEVAYEGIALFGQSGERFIEKVVIWEDLIKQDTKSAENSILEAVKGIDYELGEGEGGHEPEAVPEEPEGDPEGWLDWEGGECPVPAGWQVEVWLRKYKLPKGNGATAGEYRWEWDDVPTDIIKYRVIDDGWMPWSGGKLPVAGGLLVDVRHRDGTEHYGEPAGGIGAAHIWTHDNTSGDILAYRLS